MSKTKLEMEFLDEANKKFVVSIDQPRPDVTPEEIGVAMNDIVAHNVFTSSTMDLVAPKEARFVTTTINTFEI